MITLQIGLSYRSSIRKKCSWRGNPEIICDSGQLAGGFSPPATHWATTCSFLQMVNVPQIDSDESGQPKRFAPPVLFFPRAETMRTQPTYPTVSGEGCQNRNEQRGLAEPN